MITKLWPIKSIRSIRKCKISLSSLLFALSVPVCQPEFLIIFTHTHTPLSQFKIEIIIKGIRISLAWREESYSASSNLHRWLQCGESSFLCLTLDQLETDLVRRISSKGMLLRKRENGFEPIAHRSTHLSHWSSIWIDHLRFLMRLVTPLLSSDLLSALHLVDHETCRWKYINCFAWQPSCPVLCWDRYLLSVQWLWVSTIKVSSWCSCHFS